MTIILRRVAVYALPVLAALVGLVGLAPLSASSAPALATIRADSWDVVTRDRAESGATVERTANGYRTRSYDSPAHAPLVRFNAIASSWTVRLPAGTTMRLFVRASGDGARWTGWKAIRPDEAGPLREGENFGHLLMLSGAYAQYRLQLVSAVGARAPEVPRLSFTFIDSTDGPTASEVGARHSVASAAAPKPRIISRAQWGASESLRFDSSGREKWPRRYERPRKIVLHDTETINNDPNPAATVRAIYYYHAINRGWGDIGYNYLVDQQGRIYEGRAGGENVIGGHSRCFNPGTTGIAALGSFATARPSRALLDGLEAIMLYELDRNDIDPLGRGVHGDQAPYDVPNITTSYELLGLCGHTHLDPGPNLRRLVPSLRRELARQLRELEEPGPEPTPPGEEPSPTPPGNGDEQPGPGSPVGEPAYIVVGTGDEGLALRDLPSMDGQILLFVPEGTRIQERQSERDGWVLTTYRGQTGFLWSGYLREIPGSRYQPTPTATPTPTETRPQPPEPTATPTRPLPQPTATPADPFAGETPGPTAGEPAYLVVNTADCGLYLRHRPSTDSVILTVVPEGTRVQEQTSELDGWVKTTYEGRTGFLWYEYLYEIPGTRGDTGNIPVEPPTPPAAVDGLLPGSVAFVQGTPGALYLREGPGGEYRPITRMWEGAEVRVLDEPRAGWYRIAYAGDGGRRFEGWASGRYLAPNATALIRVSGALALAGALGLPAWRRRSVLPETGPDR